MYKLSEELKKSNMGLILEVLGEGFVDKIQNEFGIDETTKNDLCNSYIFKNIFICEDTTTSISKVGFNVFEDDEDVITMDFMSEKSSCQKEYLEFSFSCATKKLQNVMGVIKDKSSYGAIYIRLNPETGKIMCTYYDSKAHKMYESKTGFAYEMSKKLEKEEFLEYGINPNFEFEVNFVNTIEDVITFSKNVILHGIDYIQLLFKQEKLENLSKKKDLKSELKENKMDMVIQVLGEENINRIERHFRLKYGNDYEYPYLVKNINLEYFKSRFNKLYFRECENDILFGIKNFNGGLDHLEFWYDKCDRLPYKLYGYLKDGNGGAYYIGPDFHTNDIMCLHYELSKCYFSHVDSKFGNVEHIVSFWEKSIASFERMGIEPNEKFIIEPFPTTHEVIEFLVYMTMHGEEYLEIFSDIKRMRKVD